MQYGINVLVYKCSSQPRFHVVTYCYIDYIVLMQNQSKIKIKKPIFSTFGLKVQPLSPSIHFHFPTNTDYDYKANPAWTSTTS